MLPIIANVRLRYYAVTEAGEDYGQSTIATRLAEQLGVSLPTASATLKRMTRDRWVSVGVRPRPARVSHAAEL